MADTSAEGSTPADATSTAATPADAPQSQTVAQTDTPATSTPANADASAADKSATPTDKPADKPADQAADKPAEVVYDFNVPEGVKLEGPVFDELKTTAKELGLSNEQAQKVVDLGVKQAQSIQTQLVDAQKAQIAQWAETTQTDKELGGDALGENLAVAKKALDTFGTPELKKLLNESGLGNHPEIVRLFVKAGKAISEDGRLVTGAAGKQSRENTPIENRLYPNQK
ncbi:protease [Paraburkholderia tropica]|uniref:protease n=1 Tax=Paraburkholderia tropica TaxID=92647 RepID=UPI0032B58B2F